MGAGLRMRALKFLAVVGLTLVFVLGIGLRRDCAALWAQLPPPNPLTAPRPLPSAPAALPAPVPPQGIPSLAVVPPPSSPTPTPSARVFNCSCFGPASPTHWMGRVTAPSYFGARQAAVGACLSYNQNREPQPPVVPTGPPSSVVSAVSGIVANQAAVVSSLSAGQQLPGSVTFFTPQQLRACSQCTCD
jgi:hypothetical protein